MIIKRSILQQLSLLALASLMAAGGVANIAQAAKSKPTVAVQAATTGEVIDVIRLTGTVSSPRIANLSTEVSGFIKTLEIDKGDAVKTGDVIMTLDTELAQLSLMAANASMKSAVAELADARRRLEDGQRLLKKKNISANEIKSLEAEVDVAQANLQRYTAEKQLQQARVDRHKVTAPFSGIITNRHVEIGEWITPGDAIAELIDNNNLKIDLQAPQRAYSRIRHVVDISIQMDAIPGKNFPATIDTVVPSSDPGSRTFLLRAVLAEKHPDIIHGMSANGILKLDSGSENVIVPKDAILRYPDGRITVWVIQRSGDKVTVSERRVKIGNTFDGKVSVLEGVNPGDEVVTEGNESLRDGQAVTLHKR